MTVISFLKSYEELYLDAKSKFDAYELMNRDIGGGAINYDGMPHGTQINSRTENDAIKLNDKYTLYFDSMNKLNDRMLQIDRLISRVRSAKGRYVLRERYLCFRPISEIGDDEEINRCGRQARNYHDDAIRELEEEYGQGLFRLD